MTPLRWWSFVLYLATVALMLQAILDRLNSLPDGTRELVWFIAGIVVTGVPIISGWIYRKARKATQDRREILRLEAEAREEKRRLFEAYPAELGILDHGENMTKSLLEIQESAKQAVDPLTRIIRVLVSKANKLPVNIELKRKAVAAIGEELMDDVLDLERVAAELRLTVDTWIVAYRTVLADEDANRSIEPKDLSALLETNQNAVAGTFRTMAELLMLRRRDVLLFHKKQQAVNRIVSRTAEATKLVADALSRLDGFCQNEMPMLIQKAIASRGSEGTETSRRLPTRGSRE